MLFKTTECDVGRRNKTQDECFIKELKSSSLAVWESIVGGTFNNSLQVDKRSQVVTQDVSHLHSYVMCYVNHPQLDPDSVQNSVDSSEQTHYILMFHIKTFQMITKFTYACF